MLTAVAVSVVSLCLVIIVFRGVNSNSLPVSSDRQPPPLMRSVPVLCYDALVFMAAWSLHRSVPQCSQYCANMQLSTAHPDRCSHSPRARILNPVSQTNFRIHAADARLSSHMEACARGLSPMSGVQLKVSVIVQAGTAPGTAALQLPVLKFAAHFKMLSGPLLRRSI